MGACASADSGLPGPLLGMFGGSPSAATSAESVAFIAVSRWQQWRLAAAFHAWWELWGQRRRPRAANGSLYTFAHRRRLRRAFHTWARTQLAQKRAWEHFREGDADLPPPPLAEDDEELRRTGTGWQPAGTILPPPPTPRWMDSWGDAAQRVEAMEQHNKVAATRRRRLERAQNQRAWASAEAVLVRAGSPSRRGMDETLASRALQWVDSLLPQGGDAIAGEWRAVGQYTDASNLQVKVAESFMVVESTHGECYGYPLPPVDGGGGARAGWQGRGAADGEGVQREYLMQDFRIEEPRAEWTQIFRDGNSTRWSCLLAPDPGAPGGFCMRAGSWRDLTGSGVHMGSFNATAGPRGRGSLGVEEHWGAGATEEILALHDELARFRGLHHSGERFDDALADGRGGSARTRRQRELWDLNSSDEEQDSDQEITMQRRLTRASGGSPRSPESRILSKAARGWQRGELEEAEHSPRTELRALEAVARECFALFARDTDPSASPRRRSSGGGGITADRCIDIESCVHARLVPFAPDDAAEEYERGLNRERAGVAGWPEYWRFVKRQMDDHSQTPEEMVNYLLAVRSELNGGSRGGGWDLAWSDTKALLAVYDFSDDEGDQRSPRSRSRSRSQSRDRTRSRDGDRLLSLAERRQGRGLPVRSMSSGSSRSRMRMGITPRLGR